MLVRLIPLVLSFLVGSVLVSPLSAQANTYTLRIIDNLSQEPLNEVYIYHLDSVLTSTNVKGFAQFNASEGDTLILKCADYNTKVIVLPVDQQFLVGLDIEEGKLDFQEGIKQFFMFWARNINYPEKARTKKVQTNVYVEFTVDSAGHSKLLNIHNDINGLFQPEITRVFESMSGTWSPSYANKIFILPIAFRIDGLKPPKNDEVLEIKFDRLLSNISLVGGQSVYRRPVSGY